MSKEEMKRLSRKWGYLFMTVCVAAFLVAAAACYYKEWLIASACGIVAGAQLWNFIQWKRSR